ncbi:hypothetical protein AB9P05_23680 [Roseivirga sp. BDSF3-8]|uniref:hypothetical protein n=1 Tax=Roseivirga sp. BDSF3-8 TaxID=3241598 RepID=UPI0035325FDE
MAKKDIGGKAIRRKKVSIDLSIVFFAFLYFTSCSPDESVSELKLKYVYGDLTDNQEIQHIYDSVYIYMSEVGEYKINSNEALNTQREIPFTFQATDSGWYYNELFFSKNLKYLDTIIITDDRLGNVKIVSQGKKALPVMGQSISGDSFYLIFSERSKKEYHIYDRELLFSAKYDIVVYDKLLERARIMAIDSLGGS